MKVGEEYDVEVSFTNPLPRSLSKCEFSFEGAGLQKPKIVKQKYVVFVAVGVLFLFLFLLFFYFFLFFFLFSFFIFLFILLPKLQIFLKGQLIFWDGLVEILLQIP